MTPSSPRTEAEWMVEAIIDDFAQSLDPPDRERFYARLGELLLQRRDCARRALEGVDPEPDLPQTVH